ncbi:uncharacterized protein LOC117181362 isoform X2 [Belonocnema kinseyi]|uniref:uncharacterized protein LOC117181362 isoform X2 n=1 Tax=Belonocnema kinseyi TaxID=2817044 RepID=UPI00143D9F51|nr:uncharacterized protein LOC117181362 isoform X2 [Belonocnema kinseyi]
MEEATESLILEALRNGASLKSVNNYGENLLHLGAANGYFRIVKQILEKGACDIDRKNVFGWTPLMQAIRNGKINCAEILLANGANVTESTYLDTSAHLMMKSSMIPEIYSLAKPIEETESYWNDYADNIATFEKQNDDNPNVPPGNKIVVPKICIQEIEAENPRPLELNKIKKPNLTIPLQETNTQSKSLISPTLTYNFDGAFPPSPNPVFLRDENNIFENNDINEEFFFMEVHDLKSNSYIVCDRPLRRCQKFRPPDLEFLNDSADLNSTLSFVPEYSPTKSPNVPPEIEDENAVFGESTPTPPHAKTPPRAFILTPKDAPIAFLLHKYGLGRHILTFLEQEVDVELFLTLSDEDLIEIGIKNDTERFTLLSVIDECKKLGVF